MELPKYQWREISLSESKRIRSLAILIILMHNFLHWIMSTPGENEFSYSAEKFQFFLDGLWNMPADFVRITFSYLGHYGVQLFFFLSGYGVAVKYRASAPSWWSFVKKRLITLYPAVLVAACGYLLYDGLRVGSEEVFAVEGGNLLRQIIGISNFIPDNIYHPIGPWWFIGVIVQFYLLAPVLLKQRICRQSSFLLGIIISSILLEYFLGPFLRHQFSLNINHTILGHLDVCCLGMLMAKYKKLEVPLWIFIIVGALFILGNFDETMWITATLAVTTLLVPSLRILATKLRNNQFLDKVMLYLGGLSMYLFLCNGYLREPLVEWAQHDPSWWKSLFLCFAFLCLVVCWATLLRVAEQILKRLFRSRSKIN